MLNNAFSNVKHLKGFFNERKSNYDNLVKECADATKRYKEKVIECNNKEKARLAQKEICDTKQVKAETEQCDVRKDFAAMCTAYDGCRKAAEKAFAGTVKQAKMRESHRKKEWTATEKIVCLLKTWGKTGKVSATGVSKCDALKVDLKALVLTVPALPARKACEVPALPDYAGEYAKLPAVAKAEKPIDCAGAKKPKVPSFTYCGQKWHVQEWVKGSAKAGYLRHRKGVKGQVVCGHGSWKVTDPKGWLGVCWKEAPVKGHDGWSGCKHGLSGLKGGAAGAPSFCKPGTLWYAPCKDIARSKKALLDEDDVDSDSDGTDDSDEDWIEEEQTEAPEELAADGETINREE